MRLHRIILFISLGVSWLASATEMHAQQPDAAPSTTESQSGYPDVRKEASDPTLFPNPDETARNAVRTRPTPGASGVTSAGGRAGRSGGRANNQMLGQADSDPLPIRIAYRRAKTRVMERDPGLRTLLARADAAPTDNEKRQYLRIYYLQLFSEVRKIDSSPAMKSHLDVLKRYTEQRYDPKRRVVAGEEDLNHGSQHRATAPWPVTRD